MHTVKLPSRRNSRATFVFRRGVFRFLGVFLVCDSVFCFVFFTNQSCRVHPKLTSNTTGDKAFSLWEGARDKSVDRESKPDEAFRDVWRIHGVETSSFMCTQIFTFQDLVHLSYKWIRYCNEPFRANRIRWPTNRPPKAINQWTISAYQVDLTQPTNRPINRSINLSTNQPMAYFRQSSRFNSTGQPTKQSIHQSITRKINPLSNQMSISISD